MSQHLRPSFYAARQGIRSVVMPRAALEVCLWCLARDVEREMSTFPQGSDHLGEVLRQMKEDCCVAGPALWYLWILSTWAKDQGLNDTAEAQNNSIVTITMDISELCNAILIDFDMFWFDTAAQVLVGDPREMLAAQACSDHFFTFLHPIWWNVTKVWEPFTVWPRGYRGGWSSRPCEKQCRAVEGPLYTESCLINERYTVARQPFRHSSVNSKGIASGFGMLLIFSRWDESNCVEAALFFRCLWGIVTTTLLW